MGALNEYTTIKDRSPIHQWWFPLPRETHNPQRRQRRQLHQRRQQRQRPRQKQGPRQRCNKSKLIHFFLNVERSSERAHTDTRTHAKMLWPRRVSNGKWGAASRAIRAMHPAWFYSMKIPKALDLHPKTGWRSSAPTTNREPISRPEPEPEPKPISWPLHLGSTKRRDTVSEKWAWSSRRWKLERATSGQHSSNLGGAPKEKEITSGLNGSNFSCRNVTFELILKMHLFMNLRVKD